MKKVYDPLELKKESFDVFKMFNDDWALATAGSSGDFNTCTIAWGSLGDIWGPPNKGRSIVTIYISPARYTFEYLMKNDYFTVSFFDADYRKDLAYLGSHSGRDEDKVAKTRLTPVEIEHGVDYEEAKLTFVCRKIYHHPFVVENMIGLEEVTETVYKKLPPHNEFIGEIVAVLKAE